MKALKKISIILLCGLLLCTAAAGFYYVAATAGAKLDEAKLECTDACIEVYDAKDNKISDLSFKSANKSGSANCPHTFRTPLSPPKIKISIRTAAWIIKAWRVRS